MPKWGLNRRPKVAPQPSLNLSSLTSAGPPTPPTFEAALNPKQIHPVVAQAPSRRPCPQPPREDAPDWQPRGSSNEGLKRASDYGSGSGREPDNKQSKHRGASPALGRPGSIWLAGSRNSRASGTRSPSNRASPTLGFAWQIFHGAHFRLNHTPVNQTGNLQVKARAGMHRNYYLESMINFTELMAGLDGFLKLLLPYCRAADIVRMRRTCRIMETDLKLSPEDVQKIAEQQCGTLFPQPGVSNASEIRTLASLHRAGTCSTEPWAVVKFPADEFDLQEPLSSEVSKSLMAVVKLQKQWPGLAAICEGHSKPTSALPAALQASRSRAESVREALEQLGSDDAAALGWGGLGKSVKRDTASSTGDCVEVRLVRKDDPLWTRATWRQQRQVFARKALAMAVTNPLSN